MCVVSILPVAKNKVTAANLVNGLDVLADKLVRKISQIGQRAHRRYLINSFCSIFINYKLHNDRNVRVHSESDTTVPE